MHSVGGKSVLSRLQGVVSSLGCSVSPMSGFVYSMANHLALKGTHTDFHRDLWSLEDVAVICHNLMTAVAKGDDWRAWQTDTEDPKRLWVK